MHAVATLPDCRFSLPPVVFSICQQCRLQVACNSCAIGDRRSEDDENLLQAIATNEDSYSETICRFRNQQSLVASGLAESDSDEDVLNLVNRSLLSSLSIPSHFSAGFVHRLGKPRQDESPRLCKFYFSSAVATDAILSRMRNLRGKLQSALAGVHFRPSLTRIQLERKHILEDFRWNSYTKDASGRLPLVVHYEPDGSPFLWHFAQRCRIDLPLPIRFVSISLEPVSIADKVTVSSGPEEISCAELSVQTDIDASLDFSSVSFSVGPKVSFVDKTVQTAFSDPSTPAGLAGSESDISERGPWTDDDCGDDDQWEDYDSDNFVDKEQKEKEEEIAFQKRLQAIKSRVRPFTEEENQKMEDRVLKVLEQHRQSLPKQSEMCMGSSSGLSPNDPAFSTGVEYHKESESVKWSANLADLNARLKLMEEKLVLQAFSTI